MTPQESLRYLFTHKSVGMFFVLAFFFIAPVAAYVCGIIYLFQQTDVLGAVVIGIATLFGCGFLIVSAFGTLIDMAKRTKESDDLVAYWNQINDAIDETARRLDSGEIKPCPKCKGTGKCPRCKGEKYVVNETYDSEGEM